jgi:nucleoside-diphosphate-sugar epimerase
MAKKKVLVVGEGSYIGTSFINGSKDLFDIVAIDSRQPLTVETYRGYDAVLHVAGIAHVGKAKKMKDAYFAVNRDLAIKSATLAKEAGVKQFIFMSSMIIYGKDLRVGKTKVIDEKTAPAPVDYYGESKLEADLAIQKLSDASFQTVVIRTPMVYGEGCKGNYPRLEHLALKLPLMPKIQNARTVIEIQRLVSFFQFYIEQGSAGVFYPRDEQPMCTYEVMKNARLKAHKKCHATRFFNPLLRFLSLFMNTLRKMYGSKVYAASLPEK